ncbi:sensor histidine kinase [Nocardiopsis sp. CC223A]|uniref:sensor histidine kinase n=1 Tax=Nocardiopsis sp. CC223A TaxID=3044051 RepID=UPI00278C30FC|nr:histidine kinase [Nocardiopsis sp. CC223A]
MIDSAVSAVRAWIRLARTARVPPSPHPGPDGGELPLLPVWPFAAAACALFVFRSAVLGIGHGLGPAGPVISLVTAAPLALCRWRPAAAWPSAWALLVAAVPLRPLLPAPPPVPWSLDELALLLPVVYVLALSVPRRVWVPALALTLAAGLATALALTDPYGAMTGLLLWSLLVCTAALLGRARAVHRLDSLAVAEERGRRRLTEERLRIARELHDVVAHHMSAIAVRTGTAPYRLSGDLGGAARAELEEIGAASRAALAEMRDLVGVLRGAEGRPAPGPEDTVAVVEAVRRAGTPVELEMPGDPLPGEDIALLVHRTVREGTGNVLRHAPGAPTRVRVEASDDAVTVSVVNAPPPATGPVHPLPGSGHGLAGLRERVTALGGTLSAGPCWDGGFELLVRLPVPVAGTGHRERRRTDPRWRLIGFRTRRERRRMR